MDITANLPHCNDSVFLVRVSVYICNSQPLLLVITPSSTPLRQKHAKSAVQFQGVTQLTGRIPM
jgi:hypothetical protein